MMLDYFGSSQTKFNIRAPMLYEEWGDIMEQDYEEASCLMYMPKEYQGKSKYLLSKLRGDPRKVVEAFLEGKRHKDIGFTEKKWRYNISKAINKLGENMNEPV